MKIHDTHAHLLFPALAPRLNEVLENARRAGVRRITVPALGPEPGELMQAMDLAGRIRGITVIAGIHPHQASRADDAFLELVRTHRAKLTAWGEIGLDYHYDFSPRSVQADVFARQLDAARDAGLPVVLHIRDAHEDALALLKSHPAREGSVVHCFTGSPEAARRFLDLGFFISFSGIVTFPRAQEVRQSACMVPQNRLLVETDAPYLAPQRHRGRTCEPAFVRETLFELAALRKEDPDALAAAAWENAQAFLAGGGQPCQEGEII